MKELELADVMFLAVFLEFEEKDEREKSEMN